jgi:PAS domain S-box-containing protein
MGTLVLLSWPLDSVISLTSPSVNLAMRTTSSHNLKTSQESSVASHSVLIAALTACTPDLFPLVVESTTPLTEAIQLLHQQTDQDNYLLVQAEGMLHGYLGMKTLIGLTAQGCLLDSVTVGEASCSVPIVALQSLDCYSVLDLLVQSNTEPVLVTNPQGQVMTILTSRWLLATVHPIQQLAPNLPLGQQLLLAIAPSQFRHQDDAQVDDWVKPSQIQQHPKLLSTRDHLVATIAARIRASFDLQTTLQAAATELQQRQEVEAQLRDTIQSLQESELRFREITELMDGIFFICSADATQCLYMSPGFERITGYAPERSYLEPKLILELIHLDDRARILAALKRKAQGKPFVEEYRVLRADQEIRWISVQTKPVFDDQDRLLRHIGWGTDITAYKKSEAALAQMNEQLEQRVQRRTQALLLSQQALHKSEQFLRNIYEGVDTPIFVLDVLNDDTFYQTSLNSAAQRLTEQNQAGIVSKLQQIRGVGPFMTINEQFKRCVQAETAITYEEYTENRGQVFWWETTVTPLKDTNGKIYQLVGMSLNVTARKQAEILQQHHLDQLKEWQNRYEIAGQASGQVLYEWNIIQDRLIWGPNAKPTLGYAPAELPSQFSNWLELIHPDDRQTLLIEMDRSLLENVPMSAEYRLQHQEGNYIWVEDRNYVLENAEGKRICFIGFLRDISDRKRVETQLQASLNEKEILLKEIHHRVKNNLQIISSLLRLQLKNLEDAAVSTLFNECQNQIQSMALIHDQLYRNHDLSHINCYEYIRNLVKHLFRCHGVTDSAIQFTLDIDNIFLGIDQAIPWGLIINELVTNALKYAFPDAQGQLWIRFIQIKNAFVLTVSDNGIGIPADTDICNTATLGMNIVCTLTEQLNGHIRLESDSGTTFHITFPVK